MNKYTYTILLLLLYYYILYYTLLLFWSYLLFSSLPLHLRSFFLSPNLSSLSLLIYLLFLSISSILPFLLIHSFYTCRYLDMLIYIPDLSPTIRPRMFYRRWMSSGAVLSMCDVWYWCIGLCFVLVWCVELYRF